ncbi:MAG: hypothetical protein FGF48_03375 [Candidatus Brockarchaeota archaeon]|nr:hypothetical protein [Candidatus Brockarchaeota archaeon]
MNNPRACDAVVVASNYRIYLTSYVGRIPGERRVVTKSILGRILRLSCST